MTSYLDMEPLYHRFSVDQIGLDPGLSEAPLLEKMGLRENG